MAKPPKTLQESAQRIANRITYDGLAKLVHEQVNPATAEDVRAIASEKAKRRKEQETQEINLRIGESVRRIVGEISEQAKSAAAQAPHVKVTKYDAPATTIEVASAVAECLRYLGYDVDITPHGKGFSFDVSWEKQA